jgi:hypothetical protein
MASVNHVSDPTETRFSRGKTPRNGISRRNGGVSSKISNFACTLVPDPGRIAARWVENAEPRLAPSTFSSTA